METQLYYMTLPITYGINQFMFYGVFMVYYNGLKALEWSHLSATKASQTNELNDGKRKKSKSK